MDKRFLICIALLILLLNCGISVTAAESTGDNSTVETPVDDQVDDTPVEDDTPVDEPVVDDTSVVDDTPVDEPEVADAPAVEDTPVDEPVVNDTATDDVPVEDTITTDNAWDDGYTYYPSSPYNEPETNIYHMETNQINIDNSQHVNVHFTDNSVVNNINFEATKASGKTIVTVEDLKDKSVLVDKPPAGNIYKSFNILIDNGGIDNIAKPSVNFQIEKAWLTTNGFDKSCIVLNMYKDGKWVEVPVTMTGEDTKYVYFIAKVSGYSTFAITGKTVIVDQIVVATTSAAAKTLVVNNTTAPVEDISNKAEIIRLLEYIIELLR